MVSKGAIAQGELEECHLDFVTGAAVVLGEHASAYELGAQKRRSRKANPGRSLMTRADDECKQE